MSGTSLLPGEKASSPSSPDALWQWYSDGMRWYAEGVQAFWSALPQRTARYKGTRCGDCSHARCDPCSCDKVDAAVVVRARLGERRIVPVVLTNHWRRERHVTVSLSDWTSCHGDWPVEVEGGVSPAGELTLGPCERRELIVEITATPRGESNDRGETHTRCEPDVLACATFRADLRVDGCSSAPIRLALQVLPRSCGPLTVACDCGCCGCDARGCAG